MKKRIIAVLMCLSLVLVAAGIAEAALATRQISTVYQNMQIFVNGKAVTVQPNEEPFIYNERTFVPIRVVAEALNMNIEWVDAIKSVKISGAAQSDPNVLAQKDKEIQDLKAQLAQKNNEIQSLNNTIASLREDNDSDNNDDEVISGLEDDLLSSYDNLEDVEVDDISLDGNEDDVDVDVEVDLGSYGDEWDELTDSDIENWIEDVVSDIQDGLSEDTEVNGNITDTDSDDVLVEFSKDGDSSLDVTFKDDRDGGSDSDDVVDNLEGEDFEVNGISFTLDRVEYSNSRVDVYLYADDDDASSEWDELSDSTIESEVISICDEIADTYKSDADINLITVTAYFYDEDDDGLGDSPYDYDVSDGDLF